MERDVQRAVTVQAHQVRATEAVEGNKIAANQNLSIVLQRDGEDRTFRTGAHVEGKVHRAIRVEPDYAGTRHTVEGAEGAAHQNLVIALERERVNRSVCTSSRIEKGIECTV